MYRTVLLSLYGRSLVINCDSLKMMMVNDTEVPNGSWKCKTHVLTTRSQNFNCSISPSKVLAQSRGSRNSHVRASVEKQTEQTLTFITSRDDVKRHVRREKIVEVWTRIRMMRKCKSYYLLLLRMLFYTSLSIENDNSIIYSHFSLIIFGR